MSWENPPSREKLIVDSKRPVGVNVSVNPCLLRVNPPHFFNLIYEKCQQ